LFELAKSSFKILVSAPSGYDYVGILNCAFEESTKQVESTQLMNVSRLARLPLLMIILMNDEDESKEIIALPKIRRIIFVKDTVLSHPRTIERSTRPTRQPQAAD
jgi:hypothetical protein